MRSLVAFVVAAFLEIAGCFTFWIWLRHGRSPGYGAIRALSLVLFAVTLTRIDAAFAGRAFAAYGGIYIAASLFWLRMVEGVRPDRWDLVGGVTAIIGARVIVFARR